MATVRDALPDIYAEILPPLFDELSADESRATCGDCAMCRPDTPEGVLTFRPDTKCCTYYPKLPNYLVGCLFEDVEPALDEGRRRVREKISARVGVTPGWVAPPKKFNVLLHASRAHAFGRTTSLLCPYYERSSGNCTIWKYRESDCSTFFCKYDAAADGQAYWRAIGAYLVLVERGLSAWACRTVDPGVREPPSHRGLNIEELEDRPPSSRDYSVMWGAYEGKELDFYLACAEAVRSVRVEDLPKIAGHAAHDARLADVRSAVAALSAGPGERLVRTGELHRVARENDHEHVVAYSRYDPARVSKRLLEHLDVFDGQRTTAEARRKLVGRGVEVSDRELSELARQRVLIDPDAD